MIKIGNNISEFSTYSCQPKTYDELKEIIKDRISKEGSNCDLNDIDVSFIKDMSYLFSQSSFNGDISRWNTFNVTNMEFLFYGSKFNGDISEWDVHNCKSIQWMFQYSHFNHDISKWKIDKDYDVREMLKSCRIKEEYKPKSLQS